LDISNSGEVEIPEIDEELLRIIGSVSNKRSLSLPQKELQIQISSDISRFNDLNKYFFEIRNSKRPAKWISEVNSILYPENEIERKKIISFLLVNTVLFRILKSIDLADSNSKLFDELLLWKPLLEIYGFLRYDDPGAYYELSKVLFDSHLFIAESIDRYFTKIFEKDLITSFIQINEYENVKYFNKERIEEFIKWQFIISCNELMSINSVGGKVSKKSFTNSLKTAYNNYSILTQKILKSEYKVEKLVALPEVKIVKKSKSQKKSTLKKVTVKKKTLSKVKSKKEGTKKEKPSNKTKKKKAAKKSITKKKAKT
jgi:hypothetical protein